MSLREAGFDTADHVRLLQMKTPLDRPCSSRRTRAAALWLAICLPLYIFSSGPIAWATNDAFHPAYIPAEINLLYLPLTPLAKINAINQLLYWPSPASF